MLHAAHPGPDYTLRWPRGLFAQESQALLDAERALPKIKWTGQVECLLEEAFITTTPLTDFQQSDEQATWVDLETTGIVVMAPHLHQPALYLRALVHAAHQLPEENSPRPYWAARHGQQVAAGSSTQLALGTVQRDWVAAVIDLQRRGYLAHAAPEPCVDDQDPGPAKSLDDAIAERLGQPGLWNDIEPEDWDEAIFYSLVEVVHDLVRRPRTRWYHPYNQCGWHHEDFAIYPARVLYRWTVNRVLARHGVDLALAKSGEDEGRLVHQPADPRAALIETVAGHTGAKLVGTVEHAIALFRGRAATREEKRSACIALAGVLEQRRALLKAQLFSKDEGALFQIANEFDVRHRDAKQHPNYDDAYLDWLFWWYLGTVELTNRLLARQTTAGA